MGQSVLFRLLGCWIRLLGCWIRLLGCWIRLLGYWIRFVGQSVEILFEHRCKSMPLLFRWLSLKITAAIQRHITKRRLD